MLLGSRWLSHDDEGGGSGAVASSANSGELRRGGTWQCVETTMEVWDPLYRHGRKCARGGGRSMILGRTPWPVRGEHMSLFSLVFCQLI